MTVNSRQANLIALLLCAFFLFAGGLWIWRPGIQSDEALFSSALYPPFYPPASGIRMFKHDVGVMVMSYVGAVKGLLWAPVFWLFGTGPAAIRFPALVAGAISVWCFYRLLLHTLGVRAALAGCALLATDAVYMLTIRWDWGPVALQHVWLVAGMLGVVRWWQTRKLGWLALAFFLFGVGVWDKALFVWSLIGLGAAVLVAFPRELFRALSWRTVAVAVVAFCLGAFLLIRYNVRNQFITFRSNTVWTLEELDQKVTLLRSCVNGSALFGSIMRDDWEKPVREPESGLERGVVGLSDIAGSPRKSVQGWVLLASLLLLPLVWRTAARRAVLFACLFMVVTWAQMIVLKLGGTGAHHTILLWPMPQMIMAAVLAAVSMRRAWGRTALIALVAATCLSNVFVLATYYKNLIRNGGTVVWTDALYPASDALRTLDIQELCVADWGFFDNLRVLHNNRISICVADDPVSDDARRFARRQIENPRVYFIGRTPGNDVLPGVVDRIEEFAASQGFAKRTVGIFNDSNGRPSIQIFTFRQGPGS